MSAGTGRTMICFDIGPHRFNYRAAGIVLREGHVLVHRATRDDYWSLPGGRVELGEPSAETLRRELLEELGVPVDIGPAAFLMESFFSLDGRRFHEIGKYYLVALAAPFPFAADGAVCFTARDGDADLEFKWVRTAPGALSAVAFRPPVLRDRLAALPETLEHLVEVEP